MRPAKIILASVTAVIVLTSAALAQQAANGMVTQIDRLSGTMAIQEIQSGTVGASGGGASQQFKVQDAQLLDNFHAGDRVTYSTTENNGVKTITKMQAAVKQLVNQAASGDLAALRQLMALVTSAEQRFNDAQAERPSLNEADQKVMAQILERFEKSTKLE